MVTPGTYPATVAPVIYHRLRLTIQAEPRRISLSKHLSKSLGIDNVVVKLFRNFYCVFF